MVAGKSCTGIGTGPQDGDDVDVHRHSIGMRPIKNFWPEREHLDHGEDAVNMYYCSSMSRQCPMNVRVPACDGRDDRGSRMLMCGRVDVRWV